MLAEMMNYIIERSQVFTESLNQHLYLTFISLGISIVIGLVFGILSTRVRWLRSIVMAVGNIGRTIPSLAVLALALPLLGIGAPPTILALVFIGTLPIMINTSVGIEEVDSSIKESARGMGMNDLQVLLKIELPIAVNVIMAGVRTSAVVVVASATLAAFIGGGGLGDLILRGHALNRDHITLAGAIPATLLAFYFEETFGRLQDWATPKGLNPILIQEVESQFADFLSLLAALVVLPLVFGALMPWDTIIGEEGKMIIQTGLHPAFRIVGVPVFLVGILSALWPKRLTARINFINLFITSGISLAAVVWFVYAWISFVPGFVLGTGLQIGFYLQFASIIIIMLIAFVELFWGLKLRKARVSKTPVKQATEKKGEKE